MVIVTESFVKSKSTPEKCEDCLVVTENFIAVIDGVTSKSDFRYDGKTTGRIAAEILEALFQNLQEKATLHQMLEEANRRFAAFYASVSFPYDKRKVGLQAVCAVYSKYYQEIWMIGDCQVSVDGNVYLNSGRVGNLLSDFRSLILHIREKKKELRDEEILQARELLIPWMLDAAVFMNDDTTEYGFARINGEKIPDSLLRTISLEPNISHEIVMTSDGYPEVKQSLAEAERCLEEVCKADPHCYKSYKSTKGIQKGNTSFDDRTYIRFFTESV